MTDLGRLWQCQMDYCGYVYDPERGDPSRGIEPGTDFRDLPEDWSCPLCGVKAYTFRPLEGPGSALFENIKTMPEHADKSADEIMLGIQEGTLKIDPYYAASGKQEHGDAVTGKSSVVREGAG